MCVKNSHKKVPASEVFDLYKKHFKMVSSFSAGKIARQRESAESTSGQTFFIWPLNPTVTGDLSRLFHQLLLEEFQDGGGSGHNIHCDGPGMGRPSSDEKVPARQWGHLLAGCGADGTGNAWFNVFEFISFFVLFLFLPRTVFIVIVQATKITTKQSFETELTANILREKNIKNTQDVKQNAF